MVKCACGNPRCRGFIEVTPQYILFMGDYSGKQINIQLDEAGVDQLISDLIAQSDKSLWKKAGEMADKFFSEESK